MIAISARLAASRLHYAWVIIALTFVVIVVTAGVRATSGVLIVPFENEFHWSRATISFAIGINLLVYGLVGPFAAAAMDRFGVRRTMALSLAVAARAAYLMLRCQEHTARHGPTNSRPDVGLPDQSFRVAMTAPRRPRQRAPQIPTVLEPGIDLSLPASPLGGGGFDANSRMLPTALGCSASARPCRRLPTTVLFWRELSNRPICHSRGRTYRIE